MFYRFLSGISVLKFSVQLFSILEFLRNISDSNIPKKIPKNPIIVVYKLVFIIDLIHFRSVVPETNQHSISFL